MEASRAIPPPTRGNARAHAWEIIRRKIITLELGPGTQLSENELAAQLGLSRTPIRESLILLAEEQLVFVVPQVGTIVAPVLLPEIETAQFVREALEIAALRESVPRVTPKDISDLRAIIDAQRVADSEDSSEKFLALDEEFHAKLMSISGHGAAWRTVEQAKAHLDRARHLTMSFAHNISTLVDQHDLITDYVASGNAQGASSAMRSHLRRVFDDIAAIRLKSPELFTMNVGQPDQLDSLRARRRIIS
jgi:DNA-binding GntR family transcriptional regulator